MKVIFLSFLFAISSSLICVGYIDRQMKANEVSGFDNWSGCSDRTNVSCR